MFTHCVALDPSVTEWNGGAMVDSAQRSIARFDPVPRTLYLASSREPSSAVGSARLAALLEAAKPRGLRWTYLPRPDLGHDNIFHALEQVALMDALR